MISDRLLDAHGSIKEALALYGQCYEPSDLEEVVKLQTEIWRLAMHLSRLPVRADV